MGHAISVFSRISTAPPTGVTTATDTFNRADQTPLGTADSGQTWAGASSANWSIVSNQAKALAAANQQAMIECWGADGTLSVEFPTIGNKVGLIARVFGGSFLKIWFNAGNVELIQQVGGTPTTIGTALWTANNGDVLKVVLYGTSVQVYVNNTLLINTTSAQNEFASQHGMIADANGTARFENFNFSYPVPEAVIDTFNRADQSGLGTASDGHVWAASSGFGVISNQARNALGSGSIFSYIRSNAPDCEIQVTMSVNANGAGLSFRGLFGDVVTQSRMFVQWSGGNLQLFKRTGTTNTQIGSNVALAPANGDVLKVILLGSNIQVLVNGVVKFNVTETFNQNAVLHGLWGNGGTTYRYEDFSITP